MIKVTRNFYPIGQGAFYHEELNLPDNQNINVIYDCGSFNKSCLIKVIKDNFAGKKIDAVFISHLDNDHINCLDDLLKIARVRHVYFPIISSEEKVMNLFSVNNIFDHYFDEYIYSGKESFLNFIDSLSHDDHVINIINNPMKYRQYISDNGDYMSHDVKFIGVWKQNDINDLQYEEGKSMFEHTLSSSQDAFIDLCEAKYDVLWKYIVFNYETGILREKILNDLRKTFPSEENMNNDILKNLVYKDQNNLSKIKKIYKNNIKDLNDYSMTVLSIDNTSKNNPITTINSHTSLDTTSLNNNKIGFMFMGDYNCSKNIFFDEFYKAYKSYKDKILILQIPHHGSYKNCNNQLLDLADIFIISASTNNRYRHPHGSVLRALACSDKRFYWIKENKDNMLVIESEF